MTSRRVFFFADTFADSDKDLQTILGGKGASLVQMTGAGLPVPPGFIISAECGREFFDFGKRLPDGLEGEVRAALARLEEQTGRRLGASDQPLFVAVRSSAAVSMPGMMDTFLNVGGTPEVVLDAVSRVLASRESERAVAYRRRQGLTELMGTAVIVQLMVPAHVSGVLFTANPQNGDRTQMLIEAAPGLGDAIVSGKVTPQLFTMGREDGHVIERATCSVPAPYLSDTQLKELTRLGKQVDVLFGKPCDIEWALTGGRFFLLQARPIRGLDDAVLLKQLREENIERLRRLAGGRRCAWVAHNMGETLPAPTPMTWAILRQFMSGSGGYGRLYSDLGYRPGERVRQEGFLDLICGRIYSNTERHAEFFWGDFPFAYDLELIRREPAQAEALPTRIDPGRLSVSALLKLPAVWRSMRRVLRRIEQLMEDFDSRFENEILPPYLAELETKRRQDLHTFDAAQLLAEFTERRTRVMDDLGRAAVTLSYCAGQALDVCRRQLRKRFPDSFEAILARVTAGLPNKALEVDRGLADVAQGRRTRDAFLEEFGHWTDEAFELARPRWREEPALLDPMIARRGANSARESQPHGNSEQAWIQELAPPGSGRAARRLAEAFIRLRRYLPYRELGKHYWLMGYELIRLVLLEIDRRTGLNGGVFYLEPNELAPLLEGTDLSSTIAERRQRRMETRIPVPRVIMSDDLEAIGRPIADTATGLFLQGTGVAPGGGAGPAVVLSHPTDGGNLAPGYVLVCPSADPAWTPFFFHASGLIVERGGLLSHCAIVARDFGIPAVVLPAATQLLKSGERLVIDGTRGTVIRDHSPRAART